MQKSRNIFWLFVALFPAILFSYSFSLGQELEVVGRYYFDDSEITRSIYVEGNYAYLARNSEGLIIFDISDLSAPNIVGVYDTAGFSVHDVVVQKNKAYMAVSGIGIMILDVSDPTTPNLLGSLDINHAAHGIYVKDDLAYLAHSEFNLTIFNIVDPRNPLLLYTQFFDFHFAWDITAPDSIAFVLIRSQGLKIFDVSDPMDPFITCFWDVPFCASRFAFFNNVAYIPTLGHTIHIVNVSDVYNPAFITEYDMDGLWGSDIVVKNNKAYIPGYGILILDVSDPANPTILEELGLDEIFYSIFVRNDLIFLTSYNWFYIVHYTPSTGIESSTESPVKPTMLSSNPNPFNSSTIISFSLIEPALVNLSVYNIQGQRIAELSRGIREAGEHSISWGASDYPSGIYFARLEAGGLSRTVKMVLLK